MTHRLTPDARDAVTTAQEHAQRLKAAQMDASHLLLALSADGSAVAGILRRHGVTVEAIEAATPAAISPPGAPTSEDDAAALKALGIDLDAIRRSLAKKAIELSLRESIRLGGDEIRAEHLALGLLRADDPAVTAALTALGVEPAALRADLESGLRRSA